MGPWRRQSHREIDAAAEADAAFDAAVDAAADTAVDAAREFSEGEILSAVRDGLHRRGTPKNLAVSHPFAGTHCGGGERMGREIP